MNGDELSGVLNARKSLHHEEHEEHGGEGQRIMVSLVIFEFRLFVRFMSFMVK